MAPPENTTVYLPYGNSFIPAEIPSGNPVTVMERRAAGPLPDEAGAIHESLYSPVNSPPLREQLERGDKVVVLTTDNTRACPDARLLPPLLEEIESVIPRRHITIIIALGLHPPLSSGDLVKKLGRKIIENYRVLNHDAEDVIHIGITSRGTPVEILREVAGADFIVSTGFIEPHFFAGFSGGRKSILPGVSGRKAIYRNHSYRMLNDKNTRSGVLEGNPIHEDMVEQAKTARLEFIINVLLDENNRITRVFAGDPVSAHEQGCAAEKQLASAYIDHRVDITVVTNGGAPLDLDLYQTVKAIDTAAVITKPGGYILAAAACDSGIGPASFYELHSSAASPLEVLEQVETEANEGVPWQNHVLARAQVDHKILLLSGLEPGPVSDMMITPVTSIEQGLAIAMAELGNSAEIAVIPQGPRVLPYIGRGSTGS